MCKQTISELRQKVLDYRATGREDFAIQVQGLIGRRLKKMQPQEEDMTEEREISECIEVIEQVLFSVQLSDPNLYELWLALECLEDIKNHCNRVDAVIYHRLQPVDAPPQPDQYITGSNVR